MKALALDNLYGSLFLRRSTIYGTAGMITIKAPGNTYTSPDMVVDIRLTHEEMMQLRDALVEWNWPDA